MQSRRSSCRLPDGGKQSTTARRSAATGPADGLPDVPGVREFRGKSALHCPYCHGWEVRGQRIGVLGTSALGIHQALLFRQLSDDVALFPDQMPAPGDEAREQLAALDIRTVDGAVRSLQAGGGTLTEHPMGTFIGTGRWGGRKCPACGQQGT
ncbi:NAD(P)/FAD-dependent oxidoreductase [Arthrobacter mobilis]|uniref:NAD(P)/FAD-dependent oxidoreductase n=1 Tax=Arthrobacter mobilis TaxID=2724944 RepID=UPI00197B6DF9|nr:NAD(P)/FAD-dependent oxidoreductase [Arthrobacter mobilis]